MDTQRPQWTMQTQMQTIQAATTTTTTTTTTAKTTPNFRTQQVIRNNTVRMMPIVAGRTGIHTHASSFWPMQSLTRTRVSVSARARARARGSVANSFPLCREIGTAAIVPAAPSRQWLEPLRFRLRLLLPPSSLSSSSVLGRRCFRSIGGSVLVAFAPMRTATSSKSGSGFGSFRENNNQSNNNQNNNNNNNDYSTQKIAAIFAAIASGVFLNRFGRIDDGNYTNNNSEKEINRNDFDFGTMRVIPNPTNVTRTDPRRRDTDNNIHKKNSNNKVLQIKLGAGSSLLEVAVDLDDYYHGSNSSSRTVAHDTDIPLVVPEDQESISPFLYCLMNQTTLVRIDRENQPLYHNLPIGLPGIACVHCNNCGTNSNNNSNTRTSRRCRVFSMDRRTLPTQVRKQLYNHIRRCERCPPEVKLELQRLKKLEEQSSLASSSSSPSSSGMGTNNKNKISREERLFFKKLWFRMGHRVEL
mmetsp:Transcript_3124/g.6306  ORF Transcript_3124/g.6306 Transcript_3124/m.6306 type:complete len:470 (+) Transcript_3124:128-1537(+)